MKLGIPITDGADMRQQHEPMLGKEIRLGLRPGLKRTRIGDLHRPPGHRPGRSPHRPGKRRIGREILGQKAVQGDFGHEATLVPGRSFS